MAGKRTIPCFSGPSGIGKSQGIHQWVNQMRSAVPDFRMIDFRGATVDSADIRGFPHPDLNDLQTVFLAPDFLPRSGHGLILFDEINRSPTAVTNCLMELFTEGRIGNYVLPKTWMIATAINPAGDGNYDVEEMNTALVNRLLIYDVKFEHHVFMEYAKQSKWTPTVISYLDSGQWLYKEIPAEGQKYISPRTWEEISCLESEGALEDPQLHSDIVTSALGRDMGSAYWAFCHKTKPILYADFKAEYDKLRRPTLDDTLNLKSFKDFAAYSDPKKVGSVRGDLIHTTVASFLDVANHKVSAIENNLLAALCTIIPADQSLSLIQQIAVKAPDPAEWIRNLKREYTDLFHRFRSVVVTDNKPSK
jgi:hypothetical protein